MTSYDILGNIAVIKSEGSFKEKKDLGKEILKRNSVRTVLEKVGEVKGRLRTIKTKHIAGEKNLIAEYKENGCVFRFDVEKCYFSSRLSNERKEISEKIKKKDSVLVMFAGVGVYPIVIYKNAKPLRVVGVEIGRKCCKWFKENLKLNKIPVERVEVVQGDVKKRVSGLGEFDVVIMARPNLKESFLKWGLDACKKGGRIYYYGFCHDDELKKMVSDLKEECKELGREIRVLRVVKAGEIAPFKHRWRIEIKVCD